MITKVLATQVEFLQPAGYFAVINYDFTFNATNSFGYCLSFMVQFKLIKHKFLN